MRTADFRAKHEHRSKDVKGTRIVMLDFVCGSYRIGNNGPIIHARDTEAVFEQGFSRKPGGRGLGLFISKKALRKEGMDLNILSEPAEDNGVIFELICKVEEVKNG